VQVLTLFGLELIIFKSLIHNDCRSVVPYIMKYIVC